MSTTTIEPTTVLCTRCAGSGTILLTGVYAETLDLLRHQPVPLSGADLGRLADCSGPAMVNRLAVLERLGLARGERCGRKRMWTAV
jgi:hypothetical protein